MNVYEMEGFLRGKCLPGDMKVNETNAQYLVRKFSELQSQSADLAVQLANAESKCRELAAENAELKEVVSGVNSELYGQGFEVSGWHLNGALEPLDNWFTDNGWGMPETPATDSFLAEVRASGVEMFSEKFGGGTLLSNMVKETAIEFAAQLRKGAAL
ncbi:TPA: hypothetical protein R6W23_003240 [Citrobacter gillenii]|nr:hypothetical protein [Citrobacter gillenii]